MEKEQFLSLISDFQTTFDFSKVIDFIWPLIAKNDISHDHSHVYRVLRNAYEIWTEAGKDGDPNVIVASVLFHDAIVYPKNAPQAHLSTAHSAEKAEQCLREQGFKAKDIEKVCEIIENCSFSRGKRLPYVESDIVQDADMLESTGVLSLMRTFTSSGLKSVSNPGHSFYNAKDPFSEAREPDPSMYAMDLLPARLEIVPERLRTDAARKVAEKRGAFAFIEAFKAQVARELGISKN